MRYRDPFIIFGALVCLLEFMSMDGKPSVPSVGEGILHGMAALVLMISLILYVSTFRRGWSLFLRIIFAGFILVMLIYTFRLSARMLSG